MKKRLLSLILAFAMILTMAPLSVQAEETNVAEPQIGCRTILYSDDYLPNDTIPIIYGQIDMPQDGQIYAFYFLDSEGNTTLIPYAKLQFSGDYEELAPFNTCDGVVKIYTMGSSGKVTVTYNHEGTAYSQDLVFGTGLKYAWPNYNGDGPTIDLDEAGLDKYMNMSLGDSWDVYLVFDYYEGRRLVHPTSPAGFDSDVISVEADSRYPEMARIDAVGIGETALFYTALGGLVFSLPISVTYPEVGAYSDTIVSEEKFLSSFMVTSEKNSFYLVPEEGKKLTNVTLDSNFDVFADVVVAEDGSYAIVTVDGQWEDDRYYGYSYEGVYTENAEWTYSGDNELCIRDGRDGFYYRYPDWDDDTIIENVESRKYNEWDGRVNDGSTVFFYVRENGVERRLAASDLVVLNESVVEIVPDHDDENAVYIRGIDFGETTIGYTSDKGTYTIDVTVDLPEFGFYTSNQATKEGYISEFTMTKPGDTFYFVASEGWSFTDVVLDKTFADIAQITSHDNYIEIVLTKAPSNNYGYGMQFDASHIDGYDRNDDRISIDLYNGMPVLGYRYASGVDQNGEYVVDPSSELYTVMNVSIGSKLARFFYIRENGVETPVTLDQLTSSNTDVVTLTTWKSSVVVNTVGCGESVISCEVNGKVYEMTITVNLPEFAFYVAPEVTQNNYVDEFTVTDTNKTLYFMAQPEYTWDSITPNAALADIATVQVNADKNMATITFTGIPDEEEMYGFDFQYSHVNGWQGEDSAYIVVKNGTSTQVSMVEVFFDLNDGLFTVSDGVGVEQHGSYSQKFVAGTKISDSRWSYSDPAFWDEDREFEGWIVLTEKEVTDSEGNTWIERLPVPDTSLMTTAEMMDYVIPLEKIIFMAQWAGNNDDYYTNVWLDLYGGLAKFDWGDRIEESDNRGDTFRKTPDFVGTTLYSQLGRYIIGDPYHVEYHFEGWLMKDDEWKLLSKDLYTTNQILGIDPLTDDKGDDIVDSNGDPVYLTIQSTNIIYQAKWKEIPLSAYGFEVEVEDLPVIDTTQPVVEVTVGVDKEVTESALSVTANDIVNVVASEIASGNADTTELKKVVSAEVVDSIEQALQDGNDLKLVTSVNVELIKEDQLTQEQAADVEAIKYLAQQNDAEIAQILDLSVAITAVVDGVEEATGLVSELSEPIVFTVALPENMKNVPEGYDRTLYVIITHNGVLDTIPVVENNDGTISFEASLFSTYALAYEDVKTSAPGGDPMPESPSQPQPAPQPQAPSTSAPQGTQSAPTGDTAPVMLYMVLSMAAVVLMMVAETKRRAYRR